MALAITHSTVVVVPDDGTSPVGTNEWNAAHTLTGTVSETQGGTNQTTYATGDILYASGVNTLAKLAAGTDTHVLTLAAGVPAWAAPSGGGTPAGASLTLQYNNASSFGGMSGTSWDDTNRSLTVTGATVTTSKPILDLAQTWNAGAVAFTGIKFNVTRTAAALTSKIIDVQIGGVSSFSVDYYGSAISSSFGFSSLANRLYSSGTNLIMIQNNSADNYEFRTTGLGLRNTIHVGWGATASPFAGTNDTALGRNAAGVVEVTNGTANTYRDLKLRNLSAVGGTVTVSTPVLDLTQTWNDAAVTFSGLKFDVTNTASATGSKLLSLNVGGNPRADFTTGVHKFYTTTYNANTFLSFNISSSTAYIAFDSNSLGQHFRLIGDTTGSGGPAQFLFGSGGLFSWNSNARSDTGGADTGLGRNAAGVIEVTNGTANTYRDILARGVRSNAVTFANAIAAPVQGTLQAFTDSSTATWGATITGGGANKVIGHYNGTAWTVAAA